MRSATTRRLGTASLTFVGLGALMLGTAGSALAADTEPTESPAPSYSYTSPDGTVVPLPDLSQLIDKDTVFTDEDELGACGAFAESANVDATSNSVTELIRQAAIVSPDLVNWLNSARDSEDKSLFDVDGDGIFCESLGTGGTVTPVPTETPTDMPTASPTNEPTTPAPTDAPTGPPTEEIVVPSPEATAPTGPCINTSALQSGNQDQLSYAFDVPGTDPKYTHTSVIYDTNGDGYADLNKLFGFKMQGTYTDQGNVYFYDSDFDGYYDKRYNATTGECSATEGAADQNLINKLSGANPSPTKTTTTTTVANRLPVAKTDFADHEQSPIWAYAMAGSLVLIAGAGTGAAVVRNRRR